MKDLRDLIDLNWPSAQRYAILQAVYVYLDWVRSL